MFTQEALPVGNAVAEAYADPPWWYDLRGFMILKLSYRGSLWDQLTFFERNLSDQHLEAAIGTGTLFGYVLRLRRWRQGKLPQRIVGVDYAERMLAGAARRFRTLPSVWLRQADLTALDLPNDTFQTANIANAVHCISDVDAALQELFRVLQPGGTLALNVLVPPRGNALVRWISSRVNAWGVRKGILYRPYTPEEMRERLEACGFQIREERVSGNICWITAVKPAN